MKIQGLVWHCPAIQTNKALIMIPLQKESVMIKRTSSILGLARVTSYCILKHWNSILFCFCQVCEFG